MPNSPESRSRETAAITPARYVPRHRLRFITATSLFDGHDASINVIRRVLQAAGAEVIHLGHNRSVDELVAAVLQEDAHAVAVSSYQGGHNEYFRYLVDSLREKGAGHVKVFGGGGGVIVPHEIEALEDYGVTRIYGAAEGQKLGLSGMIDDMLEKADFDLADLSASDVARLADGDVPALARALTLIEAETLEQAALERIEKRAAQARVPVVGITGTGGAGKSSLTDELVRRFRQERPGVRIAVLAVDPTRRRTGGALLGDRIRMNALDDHVYMRSLATRGSGRETSRAVPLALAACKAAGFDVVLLETSGIGQGDSAVTDLANVSLYVMTPEYGAASQLEKIDMLDLADVVAINKMDRPGAEDALRDVRKQVQRNREAFGQGPEAMPVYGTNAAAFNDDGVTALYHGLTALFGERGFTGWATPRPAKAPRVSSHTESLLGADRQRYLAEIARTVRAYHAKADEQTTLAGERHALQRARGLLTAQRQDTPVEGLAALIASRDAALSPESRRLLEDWPTRRDRLSADELMIGPETVPLVRETLSGTRLPRLGLPKFADDGTLLRWLLRENLPGSFPFTGGVFAFRRTDEDPTRMFAGEGEPARTNARFHYLSQDARSKRLSTAFDSVTLYGFDPDERPDIYGKVGNAGVSIATLEDMKDLYAGFDLCAPSTSVSMTINGPAPTILAFFLNTALDQQVEKFRKANGRDPDADELARIKAFVHENVRGTVQADILKEDQGQNTCIFSTEFSLRAMGDVQDYFIRHDVRRFYSVSISGYHIAEAGANPITQLAFTLANGFTYVESWLARGMDIDAFAPNLSFFFSAGMDPEYAVLGRVARRIWAIAMKERYGANERSQKLKYHTQTSGRSLHAQEMAFNDVRTTLQALIASYDNTNSLHTNAYDEAVTTPTEESVRRAVAIQMILNREWGLSKTDNPNQGSFVIEELTDLVEEAVLKEFEQLSRRGGVLGAMETGYQRGKIQDESLKYEHRKHSGELPIIGVNTFLNPDDTSEKSEVKLQRSSEEEKQRQLARLRAFQARHAEEAPAQLQRLKDTAAQGGNIFDVLMDAARVCSLGQITNALFEVGGKYRRNM